MNFHIASITPSASATELSVARAAAILEVSPPVLRKGLKGGTIPNLTMGTIADLAGRQILTSVEVDTAPVPVLRPGLALTNTDEGRRFSGWKIDQPTQDITVALDRWWTSPGRDLILAAGGYLVSVGSIVCAVLGDITEDGITEQRGRINYSATLAGILHADGTTEFNGTGPWTDLARKVIGCRVLGGGGGNFTRI